MNKYLGQCDRLRATPAGENFWQSMMATAVAIPAKELLACCDLTVLLDDDEIPEQWYTDFTAADIAAGCYRADNAYFIQTAGFEFIFNKEQTT